jgi:FtsH-binding integral membrane protein
MLTDAKPLNCLKGPAGAATPKPANNGNNHQLIMLMFLVHVAMCLIDMIAFVTAFNMTISAMFVIVVVGVIRNSETSIKSPLTD